MDLPIEVVTPGPGQCILHNIDGRLLVERADPQVAITVALIAQVKAGKGHPDLSLDRGTLVIDGANKRVSYRLGPSGHDGYLLGVAC
jgi:hypothetical protein